MEGRRTAFLFCPPLPPMPVDEDRSVRIGRHSSCELSLRRDDISRNHAEVRFETDRFVLRDLGSTNGTFVNGQRVEGAHPLQPGDRIEMGTSTITFCQIEGEVDACLPAEAGETQTLVIERTSRHDAFAGDLAEIPPFVLLQVLEMGSKSGVLELSSGAGVGRIWFERGAPVHAESEKSHGFDAALELVNATPGRFRFESQAVTVEHTIAASVTELLLEASRTLDELSP